MVRGRIRVVDVGVVVIARIMVPLAIALIATVYLTDFEMQLNVGLDFAPEILAQAKVNERAISYMIDKAVVEWVEGDAMNLPFEDNEFDVATMGYGLRNVKVCAVR